MLQGKGSLAVLASLMLLTVGLAGCATPGGDAGATQSACLDDESDDTDDEEQEVSTSSETEVQERLTPSPVVEQQGAETVKIGTLLPLTGQLSNFGPDMQNGVEMAVQELNDAGLMDRDLEVVQGDSGTDAGQAPEELNRLINEEDIVAFVGAASSGVSSSVIGQAVENEVVMVSPASTSPALTTGDNNGFFFRVVPNDKMQGQVMADRLESDGVNSISTMYVNNDYGQGFNDVLVDEFEGTIENEVGFDNQATQFSSQVSQATDGNPDAIVLVAYPGNAIPIMSEAFSQGATAEHEFYFSEGVYSQDFLDDVGEDEEGTHRIAGCKGTTPQILLDPGPESFQERFNETYDHRPGLFAAQSYDAAIAIGLGIAHADSHDPNEFKESMPEIWNEPGTKTDDVSEALTLIQADQDVDWAGPSGDFDWNENNDPVEGVYGVWQITEDGGFEILEQNINATLE